MTNPYTGLPRWAFWKNGVQNADLAEPLDIHIPKWGLHPSDVVATMGSCFAQHIANWLRKQQFNVPLFEAEDSPASTVVFSAHYGNVYTVRQALQLLQEAFGLRLPSEVVWPANATGFIDALRPNVFAEPMATEQQVLAHRAKHLAAVRRMVDQMDVFILTLGLTEAWMKQDDGTVLPVAPGVLGGVFNPAQHRFVNFKYTEILSDLGALREILRFVRGGRPCRMLLTVSPVPLTATASGRHVLQASVYSKAVLRSVAGDFSEAHADVDYFPSLEIINHPAARGRFFADNLRFVDSAGVDVVMATFAKCYLPQGAVSRGPGDDFDPSCEEALLDAFSASQAQGGPQPSTDTLPLMATSSSTVMLGDSHLASAKGAWLQNWGQEACEFVPANWMAPGLMQQVIDHRLQSIEFKPEYREVMRSLKILNQDTLVLIGLGFAGDGILRCHGPLAVGASGQVKSDTLPSLLKAPWDEVALEARYAAGIQSAVLRLARQLEKSTLFKKIFWVAGPDMTEGTAIFRLGAQYVKSGAHVLHQRLYMKVFERLSAEAGLTRTHFIQHGDDQRHAKTGFSANRYKVDDKPWNIHCTPAYYAGALREVMRLRGAHG